MEEVAEADIISPGDPVAKKRKTRMVLEEPGTQVLAEAIPLSISILTRPIPEEEIRKKPGKGGQSQVYTDVNYVISTLNEAFGHRWSNRVDSVEIIKDLEGRPFEAFALVTISCSFDNGLSWVSHTQGGSQPIEWIKGSDGSKTIPVTVGDAIKGAISDAIKKCASLFGVAAEIYDSDGELISRMKRPGGATVTQTRTSDPGSPPPFGQTPFGPPPAGSPSVMPETLDALTIKIDGKYNNYGEVLTALSKHYRGEKLSLVVSLANKAKNKGVTVDAFVEMFNKMVDSGKSESPF